MSAIRLLFGCLLIQSRQLIEYKCTLLTSTSAIAKSIDDRVLSKIKFVRSGFGHDRISRKS
jgi:hypothetical protein